MNPLAWWRRKRRNRRLWEAQEHQRLTEHIAELKAPPDPRRRRTFPTRRRT